MPKVDQILRCEIDPSNPVPEILGVVQALLQFCPGHEIDVLNEVITKLETSRDRIQQNKANLDRRSGHHGGTLSKANRKQ